MIDFASFMKMPLYVFAKFSEQSEPIKDIIIGLVYGDAYVPDIHSRFEREYGREPLFLFYKGNKLISIYVIRLLGSSSMLGLLECYCTVKGYKRSVCEALLFDEVFEYATSTLMPLYNVVDDENYPRQELLHKRKFNLCDKVP